jgi:release factor glutamine methyltransferase
MKVRGRFLIAALELRLCRDASLRHKRLMTLEKLTLQYKQALEKAGIDSAWLDARLLVGGAAGLSGADMISRRDTPLSAEVVERADKYLHRRLEGEPVSRILGEREFYGRPFKITPDTLDPRPDTETLIDAALKRVGKQFLAVGEGQSPTTNHKPLKILDLGTGSGCILLSLLAELPHATGVGVDLNPGAVAVSRENAAQLGVDNRVDIRCGSWFEPLAATESFDLIVSNPPYIPESTIDSLAREVRDHDPFLALSGGGDGLAAYKSILKNIKKHLACDGFALLEIGAGQEKDLARLVEDSRMELTESYRDLAGHIRVLEISMGKSENIFDAPC